MDWKRGEVALAGYQRNLIAPELVESHVPNGTLQLEKFLLGPGGLGALGRKLRLWLPPKVPFGLGAGGWGLGAT